MKKNVLGKMYASEVKVELSEIKVNLSLMDDFKSALNNMIKEPAGDSSNKILDIKKLVQKEIDNSKQVLGRINYVAKIGIQLEESAKQLGVDLPSDYAAAKSRLYKEEDNLKKNISNWEIAISKLIGA